MSRTTGTDAVLSRNVRALRALRGLEQAPVADQMRARGHKWVQQTVSQVEQGHRPMLVSEAVDLADVLATTLPKLLSEELLFGGMTMDTKHWTDKDWTQAATYGTCEFCGAPRTVKILVTHEEGPDGPVTVRHKTMVCSRCGKQAS